MNMFMRRLLLALGAVLALPCAAYADGGNGFKGELKIQSQYVATLSDGLPETVGIGSRLDNGANLRLMDAGQLGGDWSWDVAGVLDVHQGQGVELDRRLYTANPAAYAPLERRNWWDLQHVAIDSGQRYVAQRIDRVNLTYSSPQFVARLGRQALTWGDGLVFHPMDLFNPFSPNATDTEYKPGADMLYAQWLLSDGSDLQGVVAPRRDPVTRQLEVGQSAAGLKWHGFLGADQAYGFQLMMARDAGSDVLGLAMNGSLGGSTWTIETIPTRLSDGSVRTSWLGNEQYAWTLFGRDCTGYAEVFHNGFGVAGSGQTVAGLPAPLTERLDRGELFTVSRNYLALGLTVQWTPLLNIKPMLINNLDDGSKLLLVQVVRSLSDNANLTLAAQSGIGARGTEYGGVETNPGSGTYVRPQRYLYARIDWYF